MRFQSKTIVEVEEGYRIVAVPALGYSRNLSLRRVLDHSHVAKNLEESWNHEPKPHVVVASYPTIDAAYAAMKFGAKSNVPVIVDIVDQWPDTFLDLAPSSLRWLMQLALVPLNRKANEVFRNATVLTAHGPAVVDWAIKRSGREKTAYDQYFAMSYPNIPPSHSELANAERFWHDRGIRETDFLVAFVGTIGRHFEFGPVLEAARTLLARGVGVKFVICGEGPDKEALMTSVADLANVIFPGWIHYPEIYVLLRWASLGIAPYKPTPNFINGIPNKPIEYLSAGLPVLMPFTEGYLWELIRESHSGLVYNPRMSRTLVEHIISIYRNNEARIRLKENARRLFDKYFHFKVTYHRMVRLIEAIGNS